MVKMRKSPAGAELSFSQGLIIPGKMGENQRRQNDKKRKKGGKMMNGKTMKDGKEEVDRGTVISDQ
jgi:hypothetical protein